MCKESGELTNHLFFHCLVALGLWHRMFNLVGIDWVSPCAVVMMTISSKGLWQERNARIFKMLRGCSLGLVLLILLPLNLY